MATSWLSPHPDMAMTFIGQDGYKVIREADGWQLYKLVGKNAAMVAVGELKATKLEAQQGVGQ